MKLNEKDLLTVYKNCMQKHPEEEKFFSEELNKFINVDKSILSEDVCRNILTTCEFGKELVSKKLVSELISVYEKKMKKESELFCDNFRALRRIDKVLEVPKTGGPIKCPYCHEMHNDI